MSGIKVNVQMVMVMTHRLVVPSAFVELLLAEQTTATRLSARLGLLKKKIYSVW